jgi:hypothetical protein
MPCVNADGTLVSSATKILEAARTPGTPAELAERSRFPLYRVHSALELADADIRRWMGVWATEVGLIVGTATARHGSVTRCSLRRLIPVPTIATPGSSATGAAATNHPAIRPL